jgi:hypothetical protein
MTDGGFVCSFGKELLPDMVVLSTLFLKYISLVFTNNSATLENCKSFFFFFFLLKKIYFYRSIHFINKRSMLKYT